jgi:hypothetical protein
MKIIKTEDGQIIRRIEANVVRCKSTGLLGHVIYDQNDGEKNIKWEGENEHEIYTVLNLDQHDYVQIPKPLGYDNPYEEFYGEAGIFWPLPGTIIRYKGTHTFWFTNIIKNAEENLEVGKEYTIKTISPAGSWCAVTVEEFPEMSLALSFFEYEWKQ